MAYAESNRHETDDHVTLKTEGETPIYLYTQYLEKHGDIQT